MKLVWQRHLSPSTEEERQQKRAAWLIGWPNNNVPPSFWDEERREWTVVPR